MKCIGVLICFFIVTSCLNNTRILPSSTGLYSEIIIVVEDDLWQDKLKEISNKIFTTPIEGINQEEANYKLIQINQFEFKSVLKTHRNIIMISSKIDQISQKDKWSQDQLLFQLKWKNNLPEVFSELKKIKLILDVNEQKKIKTSLLKDSNKESQKKIKQNFGINIIIPKEYTVIKDTLNLFWATYNPPKKEEIKQIIIYSFSQEKNNLETEVLSKTDSVFSKYLLGPHKHSYVKIEPLYPPVVNKNIYRGLWKLENGFMGGPFLIKTYFIEEKVVVAVGVIFSPNNPKRNHVKVLESIF